MSLSAALLRIVSRRAPAQPLAACRMIIASAALLKFALLVPILASMRDPDTIRLPWLPTFPALPAEALLGIAAAGGIAALALLAGFRSRLAACAAAAAAALLLFADLQLYSNHLYLLASMAALLALSDSGAVRSADARRSGAKTSIAAWPVTLLRIQVSVVYGFAALTKLNLAFLSGAVLNANLGRGALLGVPDSLRVVEVMATLAFGAVAAELFLAVGLWFRRTRRAAALVGVALHASIILLMALAGELIVFALLMFGAYVLFFDDVRLAGVRSAFERARA